MDGSKQVELKKDEGRQNKLKETASVSDVSEKKSKTPLLIGAIVSLVVIVGVLLLWTESKDVTVQGHKWSRSIDIEEYQRTKSENWQDKIPRSAIKGSCVTKKNSAKTIQVEDGQDCRIEKQDKGDGTFTETEKCTTKYKDIPQDDLWCKYQLDEWKVKDTKRETGLTLDPKWPEVNLVACPVIKLGCKRQGSKNEEYQLVLQDTDGNQHECDFTESKWKSVSVGTSKTMEFRKLDGGIKCDTFDAKP